MLDREKVIQGLECCRNGFCFTCPYNDGIDESTACKQLQVDDALTLLEAQEPRVMTLEEVLLADKPFFIEKPSNEDGDKEWCGWGIVDTEDREAGTIMFAVIGKSQRLLCDVETMGEYFRCWTARLTEEQRKAVKWND